MADSASTHLNRMVANAHEALVEDASPDRVVATLLALVRDIAAPTQTEYDEAAGLLAGGVAGDDPRIWSSLFIDVAAGVSYKPGYELLLLRDQTVPGGRWYFQVQCHRPDAITGEPGVGRGGKAYLSPHASRSELVQAAFGLFKAYEEHECREFFRYLGEQVFGPHFDVLALHGIADQTEHRGEISDV